MLPMAVAWSSSGRLQYAMYVQAVKSFWALLLLLLVININSLSVVARPVYVLIFLLSVSLITGIVYLIMLILAVFIVLNVLFKY